MALGFPHPGQHVIEPPKLELLQRFTSQTGNAFQLFNESVQSGSLHFRYNALP